MNATVIWRACKFAGLGLALALGFLSSQGQLELKEVEVCPQGPPRCFSASIQVAVNAVAPGGLVRVAPEEYQENVVIRKSLRLQGLESEDWELGEGAILIAKDPKLPTLAVKAQKVTLEHLVVRGGPAGVIGAGGVVQVQSGSQAVYIRQNRIESEEEAAVVVIDSSQIGIEENSVLAPPRAWRPGDPFVEPAIAIKDSKEVRSAAIRSSLGTEVGF